MTDDEFKEMQDIIQEAKITRGKNKAKAWKKKHQIRLKEAATARYIKNKDKLSRYQKEYYIKNKEKIRAKYKIKADIKKAPKVAELALQLKEKRKKLKKLIYNNLYYYENRVRLLSYKKLLREKS